MVDNEITTSLTFPSLSKGKLKLNIFSINYKALTVHRALAAGIDSRIPTSPLNSPSFHK